VAVGTGHDAECMPLSALGVGALRRVRDCVLHDVCHMHIRDFGHDSPSAAAGPDQAFPAPAGREGQSRLWDRRQVTAWTRVWRLDGVGERQFLRRSRTPRRPIRELEVEHVQPNSSICFHSLTSGACEFCNQRCRYKAHGHPNPAAPSTCGEPMGAGGAGDRRLDLRTRLLAWSGDAGKTSS
jgi:hypothetical protein